MSTKKQINEFVKLYEHINELSSLGFTFKLQRLNPNTIRGYAYDSSNKELSFADGGLFDVLSQLILDVEYYVL